MSWNGMGLFKRFCSCRTNTPQHFLLFSKCSAFYLWYILSAEKVLSGDRKVNLNELNRQLCQQIKMFLVINTKRWNSRGMPIDCFHKHFLRDWKFLRKLWTFDHLRKWTHLRVWINYTELPVYDCWFFSEGQKCWAERSHVHRRRRTVVIPTRGASISDPDSGSNAIDFCHHVCAFYLFVSRLYSAWGENHQTQTATKTNKQLKMMRIVFEAQELNHWSNLDSWHKETNTFGTRTTQNTEPQTQKQRVAWWNKTRCFWSESGKCNCLFYPYLARTINSGGDGMKHFRCSANASLRIK